MPRFGKPANGCYYGTKQEVEHEKPLVRAAAGIGENVANILCFVLVIHESATEIVLEIATAARPNGIRTFQHTCIT